MRPILLCRLCPFAEELSLNSIVPNVTVVAVTKAAEVLCRRVSPAAVVRCFQRPMESCFESLTKLAQEAEAEDPDREFGFGDEMDRVFDGGHDEVDLEGENALKIISLREKNLGFGFHFWLPDCAVRPRMGRG